ncbi:MAG TPA: hypothetical protein VD927_00075 [Chryseosolibacter sp.]|nr:hypothetical protein [Chryseosolibacter sp.]
MQSRALDDLPTLLNKVLPLPDGIQFHDWLFAARGASVNGIIYLDKALVQYRIQLNVSADVLPKADVRRRSKNQRYREFRTRLHWIETLMKSLDEKFPSFYQELHSLYERSPGRNLHGRFCFSWLSMHLSLFAFNPKNYLSTLIDIRKMSRGEKTADAKIESK